MKSRKTAVVRDALIVLLLLVLAVPTMGLAQEKKDNTGTNPANFTYDYRMYVEMAELDDPGGSMNTTTFEFRFPLGRDVAALKGIENGRWISDLGKTFAGRLKWRYKTLSLDNPPDSLPPSTSEVSGIGDIDARILWLAYLSRTFGFAPGLEAFFNTATNDALGSGVNVLGPVGFLVFPGLLGPGSIFAPGYQYLFDMGGSDDSADISRSQIDLFFVWMLGKNRNWFIINPQAIIDHKNDIVPMLVDLEWGFMIAQSVGASGYIRPGAGFGGHKPFGWNLEAGLKFVWR